MASVAYLTGGENHRATQMNELISVFDEKLRKILGGKSFFYAQFTQSIDGWVGNRFFFGCDSSNAAALRAGFVTNYNHATFDSFAAGLTVLDLDAAKTIANVGVDTSMLDGSLAAHHTLSGGDKYYFRRKETEDFPNDPPASRKPYRPERKHRLAVAEIIIGSGTGLFIDTAWDKYNCFRLHNLTSSAVSVNLANDYAITLKPYECQSIRRDHVGGSYDNSYHYFWKYQSDDARLFTFNSSQPVLSAMTANNVCNPCVIFPIIRAMSERTNAAYFVHDEHENIAPHSAGRYGNPADQTTKLHDLVFHKGQIDVVSLTDPVTVENLQYTGYNTDFASLGINVVKSVNVFSLQKNNTDLVGLGVNLFSDANTNIGAVSINSTISANPVVSTTHYFNWPSYFETTTTQTFTIIDIATQTQVSTFTGINYTLNQNTATVQLRKAFNIGDTVKTVTDSVIARSQGISTYSTSMIFTPFGLALKWIESITPTQAYTSGTDFLYSILNDPRYEFDGSALMRKGIWFFAGHGFPFYQLEPIEFLTFNDVALNTQTNLLTCHYCEDNRITSGSAKRGSLMGIINDDVAPDGEDYSVEPISGTSREFKIQQFLNRIIESGRFTCFTSPDSLQLYSGAANYMAVREQLIFPQYQTEFDEPGRSITFPHITNQRTFLMLDRNSYNLLAWAVNRLKKGKVLDFGSVTGLNSRLGGAGIFSYWPRNAYAMWSNDPAFDSLVSSMGIQFRKLTDLVFTEPKRRSYSVPVNLSFTINSFTPVDIANNTGFFTFTTAFTGLGVRTLIDDEKVFSNNFENDVSSIRWISLDDVKTVAEQFGFTFDFFKLGVPCRFMTIKPDRNGLVIHPASTLSAVRETVGRNYSPYEQPGEIPPTGHIDILIREFDGFVCALKEEEWAWTTDTNGTVWSIDHADVEIASVNFAFNIFSNSTPKEFLPKGNIYIYGDRLNPTDIDYRHDINGPVGTMSRFSFGFNNSNTIGITSVSTEPTASQVLAIPKDFNRRQKDFFYLNPLGLAVQGIEGRLQVARQEFGTEQGGQPNYNVPTQRVASTGSAVTINPAPGFTMFQPATGGTDDPPDGSGNAYYQVYQRSVNLIEI